MRKIHLALLALFLLSATGFAAKEFRKLASAEDKLDFTRKAPNVQGLDDKEARDFYELLVKDQKNYDSSDKKNIEEFDIIQKNLESRGFAALEKPLHGNVFTTAQSFSLFRKEDQEVSAMNGEEAYTGVWLEFFYTQVFLKKDWRPDGFTPVPKAHLHGSIYLRCPVKSKTTCPIAAITFHDAGIEWGVLPSSRGANSSAGGANQK
ncbi:MAG: hypothetical protein ACXWQO_18730 [Bdellovibrionota bacterium]